MSKPTEFFTVLRLFPAQTITSPTGEHIRTTAGGWGQLTDGLCTEDEAWEAYVEGFRDEDAPTRRNSTVVKIDLSEGTSRDLSEDWASAYAEAFPAPSPAFDADDFGDWKYEQMRDRMMDDAA
jgi:hypothetical protein